MAAEQRKERLEARITPSQKALFVRAAALQGRGLSDFVVSALQEAAWKAVREHEIVELSQRDGALFVESILSAPPPNANLKRAARSHRRLIRR